MSGSGRTRRAEGQPWPPAWLPPATAVFAVFLVIPAASLVREHPPPLRLGADLAGVTVFGALVVRAAWRGAQRPHEDPAPFATSGLAVVGLVLVPVLGGVWLLTASYYVTALLLLTQPRRRWAPWLGAVIAADALTGWLALPSQPADVIAITVQIAIFGSVLAAVYLLFAMRNDLRGARAAHAQAVIDAERLRIARDLHDVLGQRLTVVALKSTLSARLAGSDPARAAREMTEVAGMARVLLADVRATVSGYRQISLASEICLARTLAVAARLDLDVRVRDGTLPESVAETAAWVVREGTTNVLRHATARRCIIDIAEDDAATVVVTVSDDGPAVAGPHDWHPQPGNGLNGLAERVAAAGGQLTAGADDAWFRLRAVLPQPRSRKEAAGS